MRLPGWSLTLPGLVLPDEVSLREDEHFVYVYLSGTRVAVLTSAASPRAIAFAVALVAPIDHLAAQSMQT